MEEGDYESKRVIVERKTLNDLYSSIIGSKGTKGRLDSQISRLSCHQEKVVLLLVTGNLNETKDKLSNLNIKFNEEIILGNIASICCRENIHFLWIENAHQALTVMIKFMSKVEEGKHRVSRTRDIDRLLCRTFNITYEQWILLKAKYKTLHRMSNLSTDEFKSIQGIGCKKSKDIWSIFNEQF